jgi:transposase
VAIAEGGEVRLAGRVKTTPAELELFGRSLAGDDQVVLEVTGNALAIARILEPFVGRVVLANPKSVKAATESAKTDKGDARTLAKLLAGGFVREVWIVDEQTRVLRRRVSRRAQLVRQRTREKNQVHATLIRNLKERPPVSDLFGVRGRRWLAEQALPADERETVEACLRQVDFLAAEIAVIDRALAELALASEQMRRLMTLPGVNFVTAAALMGAIGDIDRFSTAAHLVSYIGFDPRVRQSGSEPARHGRISKQGPGEVRHLLVEAAWHATRSYGPLRVFAEPIASRRGSNVATVAVARKLVVIAWQMLSRGEHLRLRTALARARETTQARAARRRRTTQGQAQPGPRLRDERAARAGERPRTSGRGRLPAPHPGLAARDQGRGCRSGARIFQSAEATSSAAGDSPNSCALARGHPHPKETLAKETHAVQHLTFIRSG